MVSNKDYSYVDPGFVANAEQALSEIRIDRTSSRWCGIQFKITRISARVLEDKDNAELSYDFTVTKYNPRYSSADALENDKDFQTFVGDILVHIIDQAFEKGDYRFGGNDDTDNDSSEPSS